MVPELTARYPRAQKCLAQNFFRKWENFLQQYSRADSFQPLHDLAHLLVGRCDTNRCTWSRATFPDTISRVLRLAISGYKLQGLSYVRKQCVYREWLLQINRP
jgi:hypothetical protein